MTEEKQGASISVVKENKKENREKLGGETAAALPH